MSEYCKAIVYTHAGLSGAFRTTGVSEIDRKFAFYRQTDWLFGCNASIGRKAGCAFVDYQLFEKVSENLLICLKIFVWMNFYMQSNGFIGIA